MGADDLQQRARDHLWMHFTRMGGFGDGTYLELWKQAYDRGRQPQRFTDRWGRMSTAKEAR